MMTFLYRILMILICCNQPIFSDEESAFHITDRIRTVYDRVPRIESGFNYRRPNSPYSKGKKRKKPLPRRDGLEALHASASGQFTLGELRLIKENLPTGFHLLIVDLRREVHGFLEGEPVSVYHLPRFLQLLELEERQEKCFSIVSQVSHLPISTGRGTIAVVERPSLLSEKEIAEQMGVAYLRFPIKNGRVPSDDTVDRMLTLFDNLDSKTWLHFHCCRGCGRATTLFIMYDMLHNSHLVPMDELISRHYCLGGAHLDRKPQYQAHRKFLSDFYNFAKMRRSSQVKGWSEYLANPSLPSSRKGVCEDTE